MSKKNRNKKTNSTGRIKKDLIRDPLHGKVKSSNPKLPISKIPPPSPPAKKKK